MSFKLERPVLVTYFMLTIWCENVKVYHKDVHHRVVFNEETLETAYRSTNGDLVKDILIYSHYVILSSHSKWYKNISLIWQEVYDILLSGKKYFKIIVGIELHFLLKYITNYNSYILINLPITNMITMCGVRVLEELGVKFLRWWCYWPKFWHFWHEVILRPWAQKKGLFWSGRSFLLSVPRKKVCLRN